MTAPGSFEVGGTIVLPGTNSYQGFYNGVYTVPGLSQNGKTSFTVDSAGKITGLLTRNDETGTFTGTLENDGNFTGTVTFQRDSITLTGTLTKTTDHTTVGSLLLTQAGKAYAGTFSPPATLVSSAFAGSYRGIYSVPEGGEDGSLSVTVDPSGAMTGFFSQNRNTAVGTWIGAVGIDGSFSGTITYDPSTGLTSRPITGRLGKTGTGIAGDFIWTIDGNNKSGNFDAQVTEVNSSYRAAYTDGGLFNPAVSFGNAPISIVEDSISSEFNIDKQGSLLGSFGAYLVTGRVTNDGRVTGSLTGANGKTYPYRGIINKVTWTYGPDGSKTIPGVKADLIFSIEGKEYNGFLKATGGDGITR